MKSSYFFDNKTKPDYRNWLPKRLLKAKIIVSLVCLILFILFGASNLILQGRQRIIWGNYPRDSMPYTPINNCLG